MAFVARTESIHPYCLVGQYYATGELCGFIPHLLNFD